MLPLAAIGLGAGLIGSIGKLFGRKKANMQMNALLAKDPTYTENPIARQRLGLAQTLLNARMPGAASVERNILGNQGNLLGRVDRGATDASQALAASAAIGANTDNALNDLGISEANDYSRRLGFLTDAQQGLINEGDKVYNDKVRRYGNEFQVRGAQNENRQNSWGDISNFGFSLANFGVNNGIGGNKYRMPPGVSRPIPNNGMLSTMPGQSQFNIPGSRPVPHPPTFNF